MESTTTPPTPTAPTPTPIPSTSSAPKHPSSIPLLTPKKPSIWVQYTGIPQWVFDYRPKLPGRNMSIFLTVTTAITTAYYYDRYEAKRLQEEYCDKVRWMSEEPLESGALVRRLRVLGARVPEDGELERSTKWFKRYMRPILVASGTDFHIINGTNPGGLARTLISEIRARRILSASRSTSASPSSSLPPAPLTSVLDNRDALYEAQESSSVTVLLGRGALKEYLWAMKKGWTEDIDLNLEKELSGLGLGANEKRKDGRWEREEELMRRELEIEDEKKGGGPFIVEELDTLKGLEGDSGDDFAPLNKNDSLGASISPLSVTPYRSVQPQPQPRQPPTPSESTPPQLLPPPTSLPLQPPLLLVPFSHPFGVRQWPSKLLHFFNHRSDVRLGGEMALRLLVSEDTQPPTSFRAPENLDVSGKPVGIIDESLVSRVRVGEEKDITMEEGIRTGSEELDFLFETDELPSHFRKSYRTLPKAHAYARKTYYETDLPPKLVQARELANGRLPTKAETKYAPKIESELRQERLEKDLKWRRELEGWALQRSGSGVSWGEGWGVKGEGTPFRVLGALREEERREIEENGKRWREEKERKEQGRERGFVMQE